MREEDVWSFYTGMEGRGTPSETAKASLGQNTNVMSRPV